MTVSEGILLVEIAGAVLVLISACLFLWQLRQTQDWNRRKATEEMLFRLVSGDFPDLLAKLTIEHNWNILDTSSPTYEQKVKSLETDEKEKIDIILRQLFRFLESVCISMKHNIIDEEVCLDYLISIMTDLYSNCVHFVEQERSNRNEKWIFINVEERADIWKEKRNELRRQSTPHPRKPIGSIRFT